jgi:hypothetical protein
MPASTSDYIVDFRKEEKPEGMIRVKPQTVLCKIGKTKVVRSAQKGTVGLSVPCIIMEGKDRKKKVIERLWMSPKAYHRLRELLEACGKKAPAALADVRKIGRAVEGEEIYVRFVDDEQEGYATKSVVAFQGGFISPADYDDDDPDGDDDDYDGDELDDEDDEDDEEETTSRRKKAPAKRRKKTRRSSDDEDEDDELDLGDFEDD